MPAGSRLLNMYAREPLMEYMPPNDRNESDSKPMHTRRGGGRKKVSFASFTGLLTVILVLTAVLAASPVRLENPGGTPGAPGQAVKTAAAADGTAPGGPESDPFEPLQRILSMLKTHYYRPFSVDAFVEGALRGGLASLGDPYTEFMDAEELELFEDEMDGRYHGVGISVISADGRLEVTAVSPGGPAEEAGLRAGDVITAVDGQPAADLTAGEAASLIRGEAGTAVTLSIERDRRPPFDVTLVRQLIIVVSAEVHQLSDEVGYIRVMEFRSGVAEVVRIGYSRLRSQGVEHIILDLRNNPGGLLDEAIRMSHVFVPRGDVVHLVSGDDSLTYEVELEDTGRPSLAVLINGGSASASEVVAAAVRENERGILVGTRSYGKATVQSLAGLPDGGALKLTTAEYLTPLRNAIDGTGLEPDVWVQEADGRPLEEMSPLSGRWVLQQGSRGLEVEGLQQRLEWLGYDTGGIDGSFGPLLRAAVADFQRDAGLAPTGRLDEDSFEALTRRIVEESGPAKPGPHLNDPVIEAALDALRGGVTP